MKKSRTAALLLILALLLSGCEDEKTGSWTYNVGIGYAIEDLAIVDEIKQYIIRKDPYFTTSHTYTGKLRDVQRRAVEEFRVKGATLEEKEICSKLEQSEMFQLILTQLDYPGDTSATHILAYYIWLTDSIIEQ